MKTIFRFTIICLLFCHLQSCKTSQSLITSTSTDAGPRSKIECPAPIPGVSEQLLVRKGYITSYNKDTRLPNWVAWHLTAEHTTGPIKRMNAFHSDPDVPEPKAGLPDYKGSEWVRGHMCPAGDNKWDRDAMYQSCLFTNIVPQHKGLNSGEWKAIEEQCRRWAQEYGDVYIVTGPILFNQEHETIGPNKIVVPEALFKVVLCLKGKPKGIGYIRRNTQGGRTKDFYTNSIDEVEKITGIDFFPNLPDDIESEVESKKNLR